MSLKELINNWANDAVSEHMFTDYEEFDKLQVPKRIVFLASLWSGKSQMAFREMCRVLSAHAESAIAVLVLDSDAEGACEMVPNQLRSHVGSGLLLLFDHHAMCAYASGSNLEDIRAKIESLLARNKTQ